MKLIKFSDVAIGQKFKNEYKDVVYIWDKFEQVEKQGVEIWNASTYTDCYTLKQFNPDDMVTLVEDK